MNNEQQAKNLVVSKEQDFSDRTKVTKQSFSLFFDRMLRNLTNTPVKLYLKRTLPICLI